MNSDMPSADFVLGYFGTIVWPLFAQDQDVEIEMLDGVHESVSRKAVVGWAGDRWHMLVASDRYARGFEAEPAKGLFAALCHEAAHVHLGHHGRQDNGSPPLWDVEAARLQMLTGEGTADLAEAASEVEASEDAPPDAEQALEEEANAVAAEVIIDAWPKLLEQWQQADRRWAFEEAVSRRPAPDRQWSETREAR